MARDDSEFTTPGNQGEQGRMDLLTVLAHEIGHDADMTRIAADALFALFTADDETAWIESSFSGQR